MSSRQFLNSGHNDRIAAHILLVAAMLVLPGLAKGSAPDWLRAAATRQVPVYSGDVDAVVLVRDQLTTVSSSGEIETRYRVGLKILRPAGRSRGWIRVAFDDQTRLTYLKAWALPAAGQEYEVKEKEAVETALPGSGELYSDDRLKILLIPAADPGNVIGYEYEQRRRPYLLQDVWPFQDDIPVLQSRFELQLPSGWEFSTFWVNHPEVKPVQAGTNQWTWEIDNLDAVEDEPSMPEWQAVAGRMAVSYFSRGGPGKANADGSWVGIGRWHASLYQGRRDLTPEIQQKVVELTSPKQTMLEKMQSLATFVQHDIRYVAIEIGVGGYQPHPAQDVLRNQYGDCKDKVTLLSTLLKAIGVNSYYVLINSKRGLVRPEVPTTLAFDHVILAIQLPKDVPSEGFYGVQDDAKLGRILFFDPTSPTTKMGSLPASLQANYGLLVTDVGGQIVSLPLLPPAVNRLLRAGTLKLAPSGDLTGAVREIRWGAPDAARRARLESQSESDRQKDLENFLGGYLGGLVLQGYKIEGLGNYDDNIVLTYRFLARGYAKQAGPLELVRPRVLGEKSLDLDQEKGKTRKYPVEFDSTTLETDIFDITLPEGYVVDELPPAVDIKSPFGEYVTKIEADGNVLKYQRQYQINSVLVPVERVDELKKFFSQIQADERASVVLKQVAAGTPAPPNVPN